MFKILIPTHGLSHVTQRVVNQVLDLAKSDTTLKITLLNVQIPINSVHVRMFFDRDKIEAFQYEEGLVALEKARAMLDAAGVRYTYHIAVGRIAETIVRFAQKRNIDKIVMGCDGRGSLLKMIIGSVVHDVLKHSTVPALLIK
jgi:nucleotide-binding universal stress UspA family protein